MSEEVRFTGHHSLFLLEFYFSAIATLESSNLITYKMRLGLSKLSNLSIINVYNFESNATNIYLTIFPVHFILYAKSYGCVYSDLMLKSINTHTLICPNRTNELNIRAIKFISSMCALY